MSLAIWNNIGVAQLQILTFLLEKKMNFREKFVELAHLHWYSL